MVKRWGKGPYEIDHRNVSPKGEGIMQVSAREHLKGDGSTQPERISLRGKFYSIVFKKTGDVKDNENNVIRWIYAPEVDDPRTKHLLIHMKNDIKVKKEGTNPDGGRDVAKAKKLKKT